MKRVIHGFPQYTNLLAFRNQDDRIQERAELMGILQKGEYEGKKVGDTYAVEALRQFYLKLSTSPIEKRYFVRRNHFSYIADILKVREALVKCDYIWTCHELCDIIHNEDIFQSRIKHNVMNLLETHIEVR